MTDRFTHSLQFFADGDGSEATASPAAPGNEDGSRTEEPGENGDPEAEFEELIKGKYADAFRKRTQGIIDRRFAKMKSLEKTAGLMEPVLNALREKYPDAAEDAQKLADAFLENEKVRENEARKEKLLSLAGEEASRMAQERLIARWEKEARELQSVYPAFTLGEEMKNNGGFGELLRAGVSVRLAYEASNLEKLMGSAMKYAAAQAGRKAAASLRDSSSRVRENSVLGRASGVTKKDVSALTEKDILRILNEVGKGAVISF